MTDEKPIPEHHPKRFSFRGLPAVLKDSFNGFLDDKVLKLSASLPYYIIFSI